MSTKIKNQEKTRNECLFPVQMVPSSEIAIPGILFTSKNEYAIVVETPNGLKKVNDCSKDYKLISNREVIIPFEEELQKHFKFEAKYIHHDYQKYYVSYIIDSSNQKIGSKDIISPMIKLHTSYDGTLKHTIMKGAHRQICRNGLMGFVKEQSHQFKHSKAMTEEFALEIMMNIVSDYVDKFKEHVKVFEPLYDRKVEDYADRIELILRATKFPVRQMSEVIKRAEEEAKTLKTPVTDWLIYNAFNYQLNHNEKIGFFEEHKEVVDQKILEFILENK